MYLNKYLKDNSVFIIPDNFKKVMIEAINAQPLLNIKIIPISQLKKKMLFQYDEKTILYLIKNKNISFLNAIEELESLYFLNNKISNNKFKYLSNLKNTLDEHKLLYYDKHFLNSLAKKKVYIIDFNNLSKLELYLIDILKTKTNLEFINMPLKNNLQPNILNFQNINEEIEYLANDIAKKINNGININNIFLANYNDDYRSTIKRVFDFYNIPINLDNNVSLYDTKVGLNLLNNLNNTTNILNEIKNDNIYDSCLNILNKYYWIKDFNTIKKVLIEEFKIKKLKNKKYKDAVNLIDLKDNLVPSDSHVYLIGFNDEYIPKVFKDDDYIVDIEKNELLETTKEKNSNERKNWIKILNNTPNLTITFADMSLKGSLHPSSLLESFHFNKINYRASHYSNCSNKYNLALLYDDYTKFGAIHTELPKLKFNYRNLNYLTYNNNYTQINQNLIKDNFKKGLYLSYTKLNTYYECAFKYYLEYILKLNVFQESFETYIGNLTHYILSKVYDNNFDFEKEYRFFLENNAYDLEPQNHYFMEALMNELKYSIKHLKTHYNNSLYKEVECEKQIFVEQNSDIKIFLTGIVDKIMKYQNQIAIVDYKTYNSNVDLTLAHLGLKIQLPIYIYLIKKEFPNSEIVGIYLQSITKNIITHNPKKTIEEIKKDNLKLIGYTISSQDKINEFDQTYKNSDFIKGMGITSKGFNHYAKVLNQNDFKCLSKLAENLMINASKNILNGNYPINPKILDKTNLSCTYCKYKSICFVNNGNYIYVEKDKDLNFLKECNDD